MRKCLCSSGSSMLLGMVASCHVWCAGQTSCSYCSWQQHSATLYVARGPACIVEGCSDMLCACRAHVWQRATGTQNHGKGRVSITALGSWENLCTVTMHVFHVACGSNEKRC